MEPLSTGKTIALLRKRSGYTQADLAELLNVSDKAVSKWERGISCPDISLLPKLSIILDSDIESILSGTPTAKSTEWRGLLMLDRFFDSFVYNKPLVYYLLSYFLLVGIKDISIIGGNPEFYSQIGAQVGIQLNPCYLSLNELFQKDSSFFSKNLMVVYDNAILYGANLTRTLQRIMSFQTDSHLLTTAHGAEIPLLFCSQHELTKKQSTLANCNNIIQVKQVLNPEFMRMNRGVVSFSIHNHEDLLNASCFVRLIELSDGQSVADIHEIAYSRGLIKQY